MSMAGKVVVVTGGSMGIGEAIAKRFLREQASVVVAARDLSRLEAARQRLESPERTLAAACDVSQRAQIEALLANVLERFGRVDVWVNNAGYGMTGSVEHMDLTECRRMFDTNLFGVIDCMQVVSPVFKQQRSGAFINISSMAGIVSVPYMAGYGATKHALNCIGRAVRMELAPYGVQVNTVCPGFVETDFGRHCVHGKDSMRFAAAAVRGITSERVAEAAWRAYRDNRREIVVPLRGRLEVAFYRVLPGLFNWVMLRAMRRADKAAKA